MLIDIEQFDFYPNVIFKRGKITFLLVNTPWIQLCSYYKRSLQSEKISFLNTTLGNPIVYLSVMNRSLWFWKKGRSSSWKSNEELYGAEDSCCNHMSLFICSFSGVLSSHFFQAWTAVKGHLWWPLIIKTKEEGGKSIDQGKKKQIMWLWFKKRLPCKHQVATDGIQVEIWEKHLNQV